MVHKYLVFSNKKYVFVRSRHIGAITSLLLCLFMDGPWSFYFTIP